MDEHLVFGFLESFLLAHRPADHPGYLEIGFLLELRIDRLLPHACVRKVRFVPDVFGLEPMDAREDDVRITGSVGHGHIHSHQKLDALQRLDHRLSVGSVAQRVSSMKQHALDGSLFP